MRYSAVTPKRPLAICLILDDGLSPFFLWTKRRGSSPPSPESDFDPILFMAMERVSCASGLSAPKEIPGATNLFLIWWADWMSSILAFVLKDLKLNKSLILIGCVSPNNLVYFL